MILSLGLDKTFLANSFHKTVVLTRRSKTFLPVLSASVDCKCLVAVCIASVQCQCLVKVFSAIIKCYGTLAPVFSASVHCQGLYWRCRSILAEDVYVKVICLLDVGIVIDFDPSNHSENTRVTHQSLSLLSIHFFLYCHCNYWLLYGSGYPYLCHYPYCHCHCQYNY